jgi:hypothetical protein
VLLPIPYNCGLFITIGSIGLPCEEINRDINLLFMIDAEILPIATHALKTTILILSLLKTIQQIKIQKNAKKKKTKQIKDFFF